MPCTRPNRPHQNKETIRYCEPFGYGGQNALNTVAIVLTHVSVPAENGSQQSSTFTHALKGTSTYVPTHAPSGPALSCPPQFLQATHKQPNLQKQ